MDDNRFQRIDHGPLPPLVVRGSAGGAGAARVPDTEIGHIMSIVRELAAAGNLSAILGLADIVTGVVDLRGDDETYIPDPPAAGGDGSLIDAVLGGFPSGHGGGLGLVSYGAGSPVTSAGSDGATTDTITHSDGSTTEVTTTTDGTKSVTDTSADGHSTAIVTRDDGSSSVVETTPDGATSTATMTADGRSYSAATIVGGLPDVTGPMIQRALATHVPERELRAVAEQNEQRAASTESHNGESQPGHGEPGDPEEQGGRGAYAALARALLPAYLRDQDRRLPKRTGGTPGGFETLDWGPAVRGGAGALAASIAPSFVDAPARRPADTAAVAATAGRIRAGVNRPLARSSASVAQTLMLAMAGVKPL